MASLLGRSERRRTAAGQLAAGRPLLSHQTTGLPLRQLHLGDLEIEPSSGKLTLNRSLDYELFQQVSVRVLATARRKQAESDDGRD